MTAAEIIDTFGGTSKLARLLHLSASTVHSWRSSNSIPEWRQKDILQLAATVGVPLSTTDFPQRKIAA